jgi:predicted house-cleaning noncanonical NTP pyrophosphatase (MazG superfamily)
VINLAQLYNKAVRDRIPEIIRESGKKCKVMTLPDEKFLQEMEKKLSEEVNEFLAIKSTEELADIIEVVYRIAELMGIDRGNLERNRKNKIEKNGSFSKNSFLIEISDP